MLLLLSCESGFDETPIIINSYSLGKQYIYKNEQAELDTLLITSVKSYFPEYISTAHPGIHVPEIFEVKAITKRYLKDTFNLIKLYSSTPGSQSKGIVKFQKELYLFDFDSLIVVSDYKFNDTIIDEVYLASISNQPSSAIRIYNDNKYILFHKRYGIIKLKNSFNTWELKI